MVRESQHLRMIVRSSQSYLVQIFDKSNGVEYTTELQKEGRSLASATRGLGDNIDNGAVFCKETLYFSNSFANLMRIEVDRNSNSAKMENLGLMNVCEVAADGKHVYYVTLDGLISNLEQKSINVKLPCQEDEKFTHMKYGCGMLIAISYRQVGKVSASKFHLVGFSGSHKGLVHADSSVTVEAQGESRLG